MIEPTCIKAVGHTTGTSRYGHATGPIWAIHISGTARHEMWALISRNHVTNGAARCADYVSTPQPWKSYLILSQPVMSPSCDQWTNKSAYPRTHKMNTDTVAKSSASKPEAINKSRSTVCSVCEGIGEEGHPRSKTISSSYYPYLYLHYPDPGFLKCSSERYGCQVCRLILSCIQDESKGSLTSHGEQAQDYWEKLETFDVAQDTNEAARLVRYAQVAEGSRDLQIEGCASGRVALSIIRFSHEEPRAYSAQAHPVEIYLFHTDSCAPRLPKHTMELSCSPGS